MCGIAGHWWDGPLDERCARVASMVAALRHRGPDGNGVWVGEGHRPTFGHARLAILDVSDAGAQPMTSPSGRYTLTFNGEVYNHFELREAMAEDGAQFVFQSHSDTATLVAAFDHWGIEKTLERCVGMFSMAIWSEQARCLWLVRDRLGIKPLYYSIDGKALRFASDLAAFAPLPYARTQDPDSTAAYLQYACVPASRSIFREYAQVPPGSFLRFQAPTATPPPQRYWSLPPCTPKDLATTNRAELVSRVHSVLQQSVRARLLSDVPLGVFLSGGIDSSLVTSLAQQQSSRPVQTYSIGFTDQGYDESGAAQQIANHLGTEHHSFRIDEQAIRDAVPEMAKVYREPFADSSQIPTYVLSRFTRGHVTVALSGDGGDEVFGGYTRHTHAPHLARAFGATPTRFRKALAAVLARSPSLHNTPLSRLVSLPDEKLAKVVRMLHAQDTGMYEVLTRCWPQGHEAVVGAAPFPFVPIPDDGESMRRADLARYLVDDILVKVDRASMAVGLEARVPLLDHRVVELGFRIPHVAHVRGRTGKTILREILSTYIPRPLFERPKSGFAVPLASWLQGPLRPWCESLLTTSQLESVGLRANVVRTEWEKLLNGKAAHHRIWAVLMLVAWSQS